MPHFANNENEIIRNAQQFISSHVREKLSVPLVFGAIAGWVAQAALCMPGDRFIEKLYPSGVEIMDKSALAFTPALCAAMQCSLATRYLCDREVKASSLKCFDLLNMEFESIDL